METKTIQTELSELFADLTRQSISQEPAPPVTPVQATTEPTPAVPPVAAEPVAPVGPVVPVAPVAPENTVVEDWDGTPATPAPVAQPEPTTATPTPAFDFSEIAKVLGKQEVKTKEEVLKAVEEVKKLAETVTSIPEPLQKAIDIARSNGDYLQYLGVSVVDWGKEDPVVLYENYIEDQFYDPATGTVDYEKVDKILEKLDDDEKELRGKELQRAYIAHQKTQKELLEQQARAQRAQFESEVKRTVESLTDINGYKLTPSHKAELANFILTGEDLKESSVQSRVMNAFIKKYFNALDSYNKTKIKNATKREILQEAQVTSVTPSTETTPPATSTKQYSVTDWLEDLKKTKGF